jgi:hypothetical protein
MRAPDGVEDGRLSGGPLAPPRYAPAAPFSGKVLATPPAVVGLLSASNAAADPFHHGDSQPWPTAPRLRTSGDDVLKLLWLDPESAPRIRRTRAWKSVLEALELRPANRDLEDPSLEPFEAEDRREVLEVLAQGKPEPESGLAMALEQAARDDGTFVPQLVLLRGELVFPFDSLETLRATVATASPLITDADEALKTVVALARQFLQGADDLTPASVSAGMTTRIREAFNHDKKAMPDAYLDEQTDRVLLERRRYDKRIVFGDPHLRCLVDLGDGSGRPPAYLPQSLANRLPMYQRFKARLIVEVHPREDQYESHPVALRVLALARRIGLDGNV